MGYTQTDKWLKRLNIHPVDNDKMFLNCIIDLNNRLKEIEFKSIKEKPKSEGE